MLRSASWLTAIALVATVGTASAQASGTPAFNAPYRAFANHEFGGTFSLLPGAAQWAAEGQYRFGYRQFDIGVRGGLKYFDLGPAGNRTDLILGTEGRLRIIEHNENFPLDGAVIIGLGTNDFDTWLIPATISLGRRVDLEGFSFIAYGQPGLFLSSGGVGGTEVNFGLGFGADFKVGESLDLRASFGLFDGPEGLSISLVWVR